MVTLYRKHRPQKFSEIVNQNHIKTTLQHEIETGRLAHAYLFCGPRGVGKTTMARVLAKSLNCTGREDGASEPCVECDDCKEIAQGRSMDIVEIDAASHTGVDNVRENIIASSRVAPVKSKYKVYIIDEVHMLSVSAFNALLKILEEPGENIVFILCTTEAHKVPTTIISRCQRFDFKRIGLKEVVKRLEQITESEEIRVDRETLEEIARHSEGHMRDAESLLGQIISISGKEVTREEAALVIPRSDINEVLFLLEYITKKDTGNAIRTVNKLLDDGVDLKTFLQNTVEIARKMLLIKINPLLADTLAMEYGENIEMKIRSVASMLEQDRILAIIEELNNARLQLKDAYVIQLPVEVAVVRLTLGTAGHERQSAASTLNPAQGRPNTSSPKPTSPEPDLSPMNTMPARNLDKDAIMKRWSDLLSHIKKHNHSLSFVLRVCEPRSLDGNNLCLAFKYKFHKDRVSSPAIKQIVEKALTDIYGANLIVDTIIDENIEVQINDQEMPDLSQLDENTTGGNIENGQPEASDQDQADMINDLLKTFGGKVVS